MKARTRARATALQVLYEVDMTGHRPGEALQYRLEDEPLPSERLVKFARNIIFGVVPLQKELDAQIARYAPEWPIDQISPIDRNILRIALWEIVFSEDTPINVAINEAVELAKAYGTDSSPRFVNGVLGSIARSLNSVKQSLQAAAKKKRKSDDNTETP